MHPRENKRSYFHVSVLPGRSSLPSLWFRAICTRVWIQALTRWRIPLQYLTCLEWLWRNQQFWVSVTPIFIHSIQVVNTITVVLTVWSPPNQQHQHHLESSSVQFSCSVVSDSLRPHGLQHFRLPCPSPTPRVYSNSYPLSRWCHPTILSSVVPFSSCLQSVPVSGSFQMSQFFASGGQSIGVSASVSVLPMNIQDWFPLGWTGWISLQSKGLSKVFSNTTVQKHLLRNSHFSGPTPDPNPL